MFGLACLLLLERCLYLRVLFSHVFILCEYGLAIMSQQASTIVLKQGRITIFTAFNCSQEQNNKRTSLLLLMECR